MDMPGIDVLFLQLTLFGPLAAQKHDPLFDALCSATYSFLHHDPVI